MSDLAVGDIIIPKREPDTRYEVVEIELNMYGSMQDVAHAKNLSSGVVIPIPRYKWDSWVQQPQSS